MFTRVIKECIKSIVLEVTENPTVAAITGSITGVLLGLFFQEHSEASFSFGEIFHSLSDEEVDFKEVFSLDLDSFDFDNYSEKEVFSLDLDSFDFDNYSEKEVFSLDLDTKISSEKCYHLHYFHKVEMWSKSLQTAGAS